MTTKRPSSAELQLWTPPKKHEPSRSRSRSRPRTRRLVDLAMVSSSRESSFTLPPDWFVDEKIRTTGVYRGTTYKYYHEPRTGHKFRSLVSVQRYLNETGYYDMTTRGKVKPLSIAFPGVDCSLSCCVTPTSSVKPRSLMETLSSKSASQIVVYRKPYVPKHQVCIDRSKPLKLPDGWFIQRTTRKSGHSIGKIDKYYCERATGRVFRSLVDVQRYLADCYIEEHITLSELFKPAGLIQMSGSEEKEVDQNNDMAIVPHSSDKNSYSDISDDLPLKYLVRKSDNLALKNLVRKADNVPVNNFVRKPADVPLGDFVRKSDSLPQKDLVRKADDARLKEVERRSADVPLRDHVQKSDDMPMKNLLRKSHDVPLKDVERKSSVARKIRKHAHTQASRTKKDFSRAATTSSGNALNPPMKIKWVLNGPGGNDWSPFTGDTIVPESMKHDWAQMFIDIVGQRFQYASSSDGIFSSSNTCYIGPHFV